MRRKRQHIRSDERGVAGFQETLVAALVITIATMVLLGGICQAISINSATRAEAKRASEADGLVRSVLSTPAFVNGRIDLSMSGVVAEKVEQATGTFTGARVTLDLAFDGRPELELGRCGTTPNAVDIAEVRSQPVSVRTSANNVTAGLLTVCVWWT